METVPHDAPFPSGGPIHHLQRDLQRDLQSGLHASRIRLTAPLQLVGLSKFGVQRMGLPVSQMFETDACDYARTQAWSRWLHITVPQVLGALLALLHRLVCGVAPDR